MLDLESAIKYCEEVAERKQQEGFFRNMRANTSTVEGSKCYECANDYRQFAEWLKELKRWREFVRNNTQFINDCLIQNRIDELYSSEIKNDADILRIDNEVSTLRTTNEFCKSFNERYERWEREQNDERNDNQIDS